MPFTLDAHALEFISDAIIAVENAFHFERISAGTNQIRLCPPPGQDRQRVDKNRFPRPGLPGENGDATGEIDHRVLDDGEINDVKTLQHSLPSFQSLTIAWIFFKTPGTSSGERRIMSTVSSPANVPITSSLRA